MLVQKVAAARWAGESRLANSNESFRPSASTGNQKAVHILGQLAASTGRAPCRHLPPLAQPSALRPPLAPRARQNSRSQITVHESPAPTLRHAMTRGLASNPTLHCTALTHALGPTTTKCLAPLMISACTE